MHVDGPSHSQLDGLLNRTDPAETEKRSGDLEGRTQTAQQALDAERVQLLHPEISNPADIRTERVEAIQQALHSGSYQPVSEAIANAMLEELLA